MILCTKKSVRANLLCSFQYETPYMTCRGGGRSKNPEGPLLKDCLFMLLFSYLYLQNLGEGVMAPWLPLPAPLTRKVQFYALGMIQKSLECYSSSHRHHANSFPFFTHCRCHLPVFWGFTFAIVLLIEQRKTWWI